MVVDFACTCPIQQKSEGHLYLPIVFESFGGMSDDAVDFVKKMLQSVSTRINENKALVSKLFMNKSHVY